MAAIIVINAISSLVAAVGVGGFLAREKRRTRKAVQPLYVTTRTTRLVRTAELPRRLYVIRH